MSCSTVSQLPLAHALLLSKAERSWHRTERERWRRRRGIHRALAASARRTLSSFFGGCVEENLAPRKPVVPGSNAPWCRHHWRRATQRLSRSKPVRWLRRAATALSHCHRRHSAACRRCLDSSSALVQASLPKNNGARELVDPYVIVGTAAPLPPPPLRRAMSVQHWKTKPRAHSAAQVFFFFFFFAVSLTVQ